jgi:predicted RNA-binding Zn-ribbon protein involved in translation (DUF1610 family)
MSAPKQLKVLRSLLHEALGYIPNGDLRTKVQQELNVFYPHFNCPACGGEEWSTMHCTSPKSEWVGYCADCSFSWKRTEDHKVGLERPPS